jgi:hypothetical protein
MEGVAEKQPVPLVQKLNQEGPKGSNLPSQRKAPFKQPEVFEKEQQAYLQFVHLRRDAYLQPIFGKERQRYDSLVASMGARIVAWLVKVGQDASTAPKSLPGKREKRRFPAQQGNDVPSEMVVVQVYWGDAGFRQPGRKFRQNGYPRRKLQRSARQCIYRYAKQNVKSQTRVELRMAMQSEYRTSRQCTALHHHAHGERCDRINPSNGMEGVKTLTMNRPWKLLWCPNCHAIMDRDVSAAFAIAFAHAWRAQAIRRSVDNTLTEEEREFWGKEIHQLPTGYLSRSLYAEWKEERGL